jgi:two-component system KDP operon response regulator KdpE
MDVADADSVQAAFDRVVDTAGGLDLLIANAGRVLTHRQLLREVWGPSHAEDTHYLRVYMTGLRRKLEEDPARPSFIRTESGIGYRLVLEP